MWLKFFSDAKCLGTGCGSANIETNKPERGSDEIANAALIINNENA
jgi:hypothetical protein